MKVNKYFVCSLLILLVLPVILPQVNAALLGVNKLDMEFNDVLRSGYAEDYFVVSTGSVNNISLYIEAQGDIKDWISFEPAVQPFTMSADSPSAIKVIVQPPSDARAGDYESLVLLSTGPLGQQSGKMGTNIVVAFELKVKVRVTDTQILSCNAGGFDLKDAEIGFPLEFSSTVSNTGNVRVKPTFQVKVYDQDQKNVIAILNYSSDKEILPTMSSQITTKLENQLEIGQYWAQVSSPTCNYDSLLTFSILDKGGISDVGEFVRLENNAWAVTGEIVPINAYIRNRGSRVISAQFKGIVLQEERIVKIISSDTVDVAPGEMVPLQSFFTPVKSGQYRITGRINYNKKITYEKSSILNVEQGAAKSSAGMNKYYIAIIVIIIIIIVLLVLIIIRKKRKKINRAQ
jgi:hypothetical protein